LRVALRFAVATALILSPLLAPTPAAAGEGSPRTTQIAYAGPRAVPALFGTREVYSADISPFYKWTGMLARFEAERERSAQPCKTAAGEGCQPGPWRHLVAELRGLDLRAKLDRVNAEINRHPYVPSMRNWGETNHWETPFEFFRKSGQCQDYAITKFLLLR
jgi:predicted transglutaminase-like cysteine proteinase